MNRQIKFRVWYGKGYGERMHYFAIGDSTYPSNVMHFHIMQFTGLLDKNGKEIYEGDLFSPMNNGVYYEVRFISGAFVIGRTENSCTPIGWKPENEDDCTICDYCSRNEIIGNIHQHPELLK